MNRCKRYLIDIGPAMLAYLGSVVAAALLSKRMEPGGLRILVAALPLPAIVWLAYAEFQRLRQRDELRQQVEIEAMTIAFTISFCLIVMLSFLEMIGGMSVPLSAAAMAMTVTWIVAQLWVRLRYRYW